MLFDPNKPLAAQIVAFLEKAATLTPAQWARSNISSVVNCEKLNVLLRDRVLSEGRPWTRNIEPFHCRHFEFLYDQNETESLYRKTYDLLRADYRLDFIRPEFV